MQHMMHKVLRDFVPEVTIPFVDDIPINGCVVEEKDDSIIAEGCRKFVSDHIRDVERILIRLEEIHLTLSGAKSHFGVSEILVVGHLCGAFGRRPNPEKVDALARMKDCQSVKQELWGVLTALKVDKDFLIGAYVVLKTDCLPLLGMIANCNTPDITILRWIAYIRSMNLELRHIAGKKNVVADMLSRARYADEKEMLAVAEEEELNDTWCQASEQDVDMGVLPFREELILVYDGETKQKLLTEFHDTLWAGHRGVWATYMKIKERYWWRGLYRDVESFVRSCLHCQFYSKVRYRDGLVPTFPHSIHFRWVLDLVMMPPGLWGLKYIVLACEDLSNYVEGRALRSKSTESICWFVLEDTVCRYGSVGSLRADRGDLDFEEARVFFRRYGVKLKLTSAYNLEKIGKSERGHPPIVHALVKACNGKRREWPRLLPFALWADRTTHCSTTGYMPVELMLGQKPIMPVEDDVHTWASILWKDNLDRDSLLALRCRVVTRFTD
ncbi:hypothetical protein R1sor_015969 [Riccia sorocarpa]|uniref:Integrase catalytic domain-containing protein n=1 Tax=Riccia sorocarpa TaxID=122646 RepID=A0ABD3HHR2_9MARC